MGVVYLARDPELDRMVAVKFVTPAALAQRGGSARLRDEARAMARVRHPNVVVVHSYGEYSRLPYFVMEYVAGCDLSEWLERRGGPPLDLDALQDVVVSICHGLHAIHSADATHGDIKPSNILVGLKGEIVISDLGLSRHVAQTSHRHHFAGTPEYMAPEVIGMAEVPRELAARADVYSLGVITYELLTGQLPFEEKDLVRLLNMHATMSPRPPSAVADVSPAFDNLLLHALAKDPALRVESVEDFRMEFETAMATARSPLAGACVAIIDDDPAFLRYVETALRDDLPDTRTLLFADPARAVAELPDAGVVAIVVDLDMPEINGMELLALLRGQPTLEGIPILVVTGVGGAKDWAVLEKVGASGMLHKPLKPRVLAEALRDAVRRRTGWSFPPPKRPSR